MIPKLFSSVWSDLGEVHKTTEIISRFSDADRHRVYSLLELSPLEVNLRPAVVLLVSRMFNYIPHKTVNLAAMVQLVFLGIRTHRRVGEDGLRPDDHNRLAVLIGDYCYCRFFALATAAGMVEFLRPLSEIVCRLNDGAISRLQVASTPGLLREAVRQETAVLIAEACRMAGQVGGVSDADQRLLFHLGYDLGMGHGLMEQGLRFDAWEHLQAARALLKSFPPGAPRDALDALIVHLVDWPEQSVAGIKG